MKLKVKYKSFIYYNIGILIFTIIFGKIGLFEKISRYIKFETVIIKFQDLLSISITILTVFVGAIITVATVLISMCDKRIIKLIRNNNKSSYLVLSIKTAIITGVMAIILLAIVYARIDFNNLRLRCVILYLTGYLLVVFISKSKLLILIVLGVLNEAFNNNETYIVSTDFKKTEDKLNNKE
ncbi:MAG: hypothetical protein ABRQ25_08600 [Clostridiaceae bacterium]